jgi:TolA-binding protein
VPQALLLLAETGLAREARHDAARAYLEQLVLQYPDSSEARRARAILAELRKSDAHS